ncbi:MAG: hypothetical protein D6730_02080 [Bacteroidetes bacterium]|nr:MAG: hypothetical protein D6730_02080 [Bacteroidota bacterium]
MFSEGLTIFTLMLVAAILGFLIGWFLHAYINGKKFRILQGRYNEQVRKYNQLQNDYLSQQSKQKEAEKQHADLLARYNMLESQNTSLEESLRQAKDAAKRFQAEKIELKQPKGDTRSVAGGQQSRKAEALSRIKERAQGLDFGQIGMASADEKDDLQRIKGIGPFIEEKLHTLGIYTFRQIANFTEELEDKVNEAIEFFPGRIRRDGWVKQARELVSQQEESQSA